MTCWTEDDALPTSAAAFDADRSASLRLLPWLRQLSTQRKGAFLRPYVYKYNTDHGKGQCYDRMYISTIQTMVKGSATTVCT